jgi:hypothetical protein
MTNQLNNMPPISYEDWAFLNDNPNTDDVVAWIHNYAQAYAAQQVAELDAARAAALLALAHIRWNQFGECRTVNHDGPPPTAAEADAALVAALSNHTKEAK